MADEETITGSSGRERSTSTSLIRRIKDKDDDAWRRLSDLYGPLVYHWCRRSGLRAEDAADVVQEVFRAVALGIETFRKEREGDTFRGWLWTITRNKVCDHIRAAEGRPEATGGTDFARRLMEIPQTQPEVSDDSAGSAALRRLLLRAAELIRPEFREPTWRAFCLTALAGHNSTEAAAELGMTPHAVRKAKSRVLRRLREELGEEDDWRVSKLASRCFLLAKSPAMSHPSD